MDELEIFSLTIKRNRHQFRSSKAFQALCMAEKALRRGDSSRILRAASLVRSEFLARGFFVPIATTWLCCLARLHRLASEPDDRGVAADIVYSDSSDDFEPGFYISKKPRLEE